MGFYSIQISIIESQIYAASVLPKLAGAYNGRLADPQGQLSVFVRTDNQSDLRERSGEPLFESRGQSEGTSSAVATVLPAMFIAALKDFPGGSPTNPRRVTVETAH